MRETKKKGVRERGKRAEEISKHADLVEIIITASTRIVGWVAGGIGCIRYLSKGERRKKRKIEVCEREMR